MPIFLLYCIIRENTCCCIQKSSKIPCVFSLHGKKCNRLKTWYFKFNIQMERLHSVMSYPPFSWRFFHCDNSQCQQIIPNGSFVTPEMHSWHQSSSANKSEILSGFQIRCGCWLKESSEIVNMTVKFAFMNALATTFKNCCARTYETPTLFSELQDKAPRVSSKAPVKETTHLHDLEETTMILSPSNILNETLLSLSILALLRETISYLGNFRAHTNYPWPKWM